MRYWDHSICLMRLKLAPLHCQACFTCRPSRSSGFPRKLPRGLCLQGSWGRVYFCSWHGLLSPRLPAVQHSTNRLELSGERSFLTALLRELTLPQKRRRKTRKATKLCTRLTQLAVKRGVYKAFPERVPAWFYSLASFTAIQILCRVLMLARTASRTIT
jgi:hypothetical protein